MREQPRPRYNNPVKNRKSMIHTKEQIERKKLEQAKKKQADTVTYSDIKKIEAKESELDAISRLIDKVHNNEVPEKDLPKVLKMITEFFQRNRA